MTTATTGADIPQLTSNGSVVSQINVTYLAQGIINSVTSSYGSLLASEKVDPSGAVTQQNFGDAANTVATMVYDPNERLTGYALSRTAGANNGAWANYAQKPPTPGDLLAASVFPESHPYARQVVGTEENLDRLTLSDAREFAKTYYRPAQCVVAVSSPSSLQAQSGLLANVEGVHGWSPAATDALRAIGIRRGSLPACATLRRRSFVLTRAILSRSQARSNA